MRHRHWTGFDHLRVYMIIGAANSLFTLIRAFSFAYGGVCGAVTAHDRLLASGMCPADLGAPAIDVLVVVFESIL